MAMDTLAFLVPNRPMGPEESNGDEESVDSEEMWEQSISVL